MTYSQFIDELSKSESRCKLMRTTWFTPELRRLIKRNYITSNFKIGDRKYLLVSRTW